MDVKQWVETFPGHKTWNGDETSVLCPFHDDHTPSCSVNAVKGIFLCHACGERGTLRELAEKLGVQYPSRKSPNNQKTSPSPETAYRYQDEKGNTVYESVRYEKGGKKTFYLRKPDGTKGIKGIQHVPYRLPDVKKALSEGKDVIIGYLPFSRVNVR